MKFIYIFVFTLIAAGCSTLKISSASVLPDQNLSGSITVFALDNYTDTPQAGMRASNLIEGILIVKGYPVVKGIDITESSLQEQLRIASKNGSEYLLNGGVSEWRYKTGIDGEPAISLQCKMIKVDTGKIVWSATASSNDWGNASIGTTAHSMISSMFETK